MPECSTSLQLWITKNYLKSSQELKTAIKRRWAISTKYSTAAFQINVVKFLGWDVTVTASYPLWGQRCSRITMHPSHAVVPHCAQVTQLLRGRNCAWNCVSGYGVKKDLSDHPWWEWSDLHKPFLQTSMVKCKIPVIKSQSQNKNSIFLTGKILVGSSQIPAVPQNCALGTAKLTRKAVFKTPKNSSSSSWMELDMSLVRQCKLIPQLICKENSDING